MNGAEPILKKERPLNTMACKGPFRWLCNASILPTCTLSIGAYSSDDPGNFFPVLNMALDRPVKSPILVDELEPFAFWACNEHALDQYDR